MRRLRDLTQALPAFFRIGFAEIVAYRAEMVIWILTATLPLVMLALWNAASADGPIGKFGQTEFARYFAITLLVRQLTGSWVLWELNYMIRTGGLSPWLLRPLNPLWYNLVSTVAAVPMRVVVLLPILGGLFWWRPEIAFSPGLARLGMFVLSVALAFLLSWLIQAAFGMLAFWLDQSLGLFQLWFGLWALLSGYFLPTALLPWGLSGTTGWLPFYASLGAPIDLLLGTGADPSRILGVQAAWTVAGLVATATMWRVGVRRYGAYGA